MSFLRYDFRSQRLLIKKNTTAVISLEFSARDLSNLNSLNRKLPTLFFLLVNCELPLLLLFECFFQRLFFLKVYLHLSLEGAIPIFFHYFCETSVSFCLIDDRSFVF